MSLQLEGVTTRFGALCAVDDVSMEVPSSDLVGIIGPNGAGKSTLFATITGFLNPDSGSIRYDGHLLNGRRPEDRVLFGLGRTFQVPREFRHLTVRENLAVAIKAQAGENIIDLFVRPHAVARQEIEVARRVDDVIGFLNLTAVAGQLAGKISGGQKKLLELGRALLVDPSFLLLDEPFGGINPVLIKEISERIRALHARGIGFLIVEHNLSALCRLVGKLFVMDHGRILAYGPPDQVLADPKVREAYMGGKA